MLYPWIIKKVIINCQIKEISRTKLKVGTETLFYVKSFMDLKITIKFACLRILRRAAAAPLRPWKRHRRSHRQQRPDARRVGLRREAHRQIICRRCSLIHHCTVMSLWPTHGRHSLDGWYHSSSFYPAVWHFHLSSPMVHWSDITI